MMRDGGQLTETSWEACLDDLGARLRDIIAEHGPARSPSTFGTGIGMDAAGYRTAEALQPRDRHAAKFSPLTIDGTAKVSDRGADGRLGRPHRAPDYENAELVHPDRSNPVVSHGHTVACPILAGCFPRPRRPGSALGRRSPPHRDRPVGDPPSRAATGHRLRGAGLPGARDKLRGAADPDVAVQDLDLLDSAVEPFTREHAAELADVDPADLGRSAWPPSAGPGHIAIDNRYRRHHVGQCQRDAMVFVGAADPDRSMNGPAE